MTKNKWAVAVIFFLAAMANAQDDGRKEADPLFQSHDIVPVTITGPIKELMDERPTEEYLPGTLSYVDPGGDTVDIEIGLRTRGRYRRQERICPFAPIRINFKKKQAKDTLFDKQDKMKLVAHCRDRSTRYEQLVLKEYLAYRILNELTDDSFRVRLLRINYVDTDDPDYERVRYGFLIEHHDRLAKRIGRESLEIARTSVASLDPEYTNLTSVFQYFIANTDFSPILGAADDTCCHNAKLFSKDGEMIYSIPYDFDMAGLTDAPYASPNEKFRIRSVRQRLYRGRCGNNEHLSKSLDLLKEKKAAIYDLVQNQQDLNGSSKKSMLSLIDRFYDMAEGSDKLEKRLVRTCV